MRKSFIVMTVAWLGMATVDAVSAQTFQTLTVEPVNPTNGRPWGRLQFDHNGLVIDGVNENGTPFGKLKFTGNELSLDGFGDPPKVRLASENGSGAVSFNYLRSDGVHEELFLVLGGLDEENPSSLAGQLKLFARTRNTTGDASMRLMGVISSAYTEDGEPRVRWHPNSVLDLERMTEQASGAIPRATALTLTGTGGNVPSSVTQRDFDIEGTAVVGFCSAGEIVVAGGGSCSNGALRGSRPQGGGWEIVCQESGVNRVSVTCAKQ
jgi:hypothetical protein